MHGWGGSVIIQFVLMPHACNPCPVNMEYDVKTTSAFSRNRYGYYDNTQRIVGILKLAKTACSAFQCRL